MKEDFLHFVWQYQYFDKVSLTTTTGDHLVILRQGFSNKDSGPDYSDARIKIKNIEWAGNVEIHYKSSEWQLHKHNVDTAYDNVILHVVWSDDKPVCRTDNSPIPTLELKHRISQDLILKYSKLIKYSEDIVCSPFFPTVPQIVKNAMMDKVLVKRLEEKSARIREMLKQNSNNWEQTTYQILAANFGFKLNEACFVRLSRALPFSVISKHFKNRLQLEAMLFGMAGMLQYDFNDAYPNSLKKEFAFLAHKYGLEKESIRKSDWKFSKIRPANFPTIRLAQFAAFLHKNFPLFSTLLELDQVNTLFSKEQEEKDSYWASHYLFDKETSKHSYFLGKSSELSIIINTIVPILVAYSLEKDDEQTKLKAITLLENIAAEKNYITEKWTMLGLEIKTSFDSQAAIELFNNYCRVKACLRCTIGVSIIQGKHL